MATTYTNLLFHIVYSTKYRKDIITSDVQGRLYEYIGGIIRDQQGIVLEIGGMPDHVHILAKLSSTLAISDVLRITKANSSKWFNATFTPKTPFAWQRGFGGFSVSTSHVDCVREYIRNQSEHHTEQSFKDEFRRLLIRHGIQFEEKYLFEEEHIV
jgi:REP element-mobilizing transposase RayT